MEAIASRSLAHGVIAPRHAVAVRETLPTSIPVLNPKVERTRDSTIIHRLRTTLEDHLKFHNLPNLQLIRFTSPLHNRNRLR